MLDLPLETAPVPSALLSRARLSREEPAPGETPPPWAAVLARFYARHGLPLPRMVRLKPRELPAACRRLLAHNNDMTPTLERYHEERVSLRVCSRERQGDAYLREVVLALAGRGLPVEYGAICIHLQHFSEPVQRLILAAEHPFGRILHAQGIAHLGWPQAFFSIEADLHIRRLLGLSAPHSLFGRRNVLLDGRRRLLAEVIEILPPLPMEPRTS
jgi:chorismate-pyruvate lyase